MKIQYEERYYPKVPPVEHAERYLSEVTMYFRIGTTACCENGRLAWIRHGVLDFGDISRKGRPEVNIASYIKDDYEDDSGAWYSEPISFCPWCGAKIAFECVKKTKIEYDCKELVDKRTVCEERIVEQSA